MSSHSRSMAGQFRRFGGEDTSPITWFQCAVVVAFCATMVAIPWDDFGGSFWDRSIYMRKFVGAHPGEQTFVESTLSFITDEVLWDMAVKWCVASLGMSVENVFQAITFLCLFAFAKFIVSRHGLPALVFLVNPLVLDFSFSQLRMALAVALLLFAAFQRKHEVVATALAATACFIHTASFLLLFMFFSIKIVTEALASRKRISGFYFWAGLLAISLAVIVVIGPLRSGIMSKLGDRRADYEAVAQGFKYTSFWIGLMLVMGAQPKMYFEKEGNAVAATFVGTFVFGSLFNVYNVRFLSAAYPLIVSSMFALERQWKAAVIPLYLIYVSLQWYYWSLMG